MEYRSSLTVEPEKNRKVIDVTSSTLSEDKKKALFGLHAFSGNDYVSSFFGKGKITLWKNMLQRSEFIEMFAALGSRAHASDDLIQELENFVCVLYGDQRIGSVDDRGTKCSSISLRKKGKFST
ncbi:hypothetical protein HOLleu_21226 [Holothuria leucospilota]|uniref:Uncharacterized protein n=1 Tax=Holothuria leucospilota TaxID=206669 RepID=A0A9Q1BXH8_HOLLE|nr:hypothetical protein HOLleu_21226 [Holothuria leucospilota]